MRLRGGFTKTMMMSMMSKDIPVVKPDNFKAAEYTINQEGFLLSQSVQGDVQGAETEEMEEGDEDMYDDVESEEENDDIGVLGGCSLEANQTLASVEVAKDECVPMKAGGFFGHYKGKDKDKVRNHLMDIARIIGLSDMPAMETQKAQVEVTDTAVEEEEDDLEPDVQDSAMAANETSPEHGVVASWMNKVAAAREVAEVENYTEAACEDLDVAKHSGDDAVKFTHSVAEKQNTVPGKQAKKLVEVDASAVVSQKFKVFFFQSVHSAG
jgi:hypothetical protein